MNNLSAEAKELINDLLGKGYTTFEIKEAMEDGAFLAEAGISQEISEEVHFLLKNLYDSLLLKGYSKEELIKLCENDSELYDIEKDEFRPVTWEYIEENYDVLELCNGNFVLNSR